MLTIAVVAAHGMVENERRMKNVARKVPEITLIFWVIKVLTTAMGETTSDYLVHQIDPVVAVAIGGVAFVAAMGLQLLAPRYVAWVYWLAVAMVAVFGTMVADVLHIGLGVPYVVSASGFAVALGIVFLAWRASEGTLSVHSITTRRRECFYWAAVVTTFALGTAVGDLTASTMGLGYLASGVVFGILFALPYLAHRFLGLGAVPAFWIAYILTRPFGASLADWTGKPPSFSGLGVGTGLVSVVLTILIVILVGSLVVRRDDAPADAPQPSGTGGG